MVVKSHRKIEQQEEHGERLPGESEVRPCILLLGPGPVSHLPAMKYKLMQITPEIFTMRDPVPRLLTRLPQRSVLS